ncbi:hypothetical protein GK047_27780 [Paenibacillus sp. SYP-B3998]|uniref:Copper amine oxidase-like N-terminal domain-containing protein n=1 Tax=Paenibacillus sp. SYP-B3998 TaxID=2678564 RepID=A0A6G4A7Y1_9BACL|nr:stalk domain-containing protein [Paenibacillus sp. SYP-B3998]NEW09727.1 hypothetical protein [Paenibacillus sp. SYP-B3998]
MKKIVIGLVLGAGITCSTAVYASDAIQAINYNGHAYVPLRFVAESMRAQVEFNETEQQMSIKYGTPTEQLKSRIEMTALQLFETAGRGDLNETNFKFYTGKKLNSGGARLEKQVLLHRCCH